MQSKHYIQRIHITNMQTEKINDWTEKWLFGNTMPLVAVSIGLVASVVTFVLWRMTWQ